MKNKSNDDREDRIAFILPLSVKNEFFRLCREDARNPSLVLRKAVMDFIAANSNGQATDTKRISPSQR